MYRPEALCPKAQPLVVIVVWLTRKCSASCSLCVRYNARVSSSALENIQCMSGMSGSVHVWHIAKQLNTQPGAR